MDEATITDFISATFAGVERMDNYGYTFFFYGSERMLPFATIAQNGNTYEQIAQLHRPGVFRLNIGVGPHTFQHLFGADRVDTSTYDFAALDTIMPHPEYAAQWFVCVLNPSEPTFHQQIRPLLAEAYERAVTRAQRR